MAAANVDHFALLSRAIEASKANPGQARSAIYDMARVKLHREILWQNPEISEADLRTHLLALEDAIERVEATHSESYDNLVFRADDPVAQFAASIKTAPVEEPKPTQDAQQEAPQEQSWLQEISLETRPLESSQPEEAFPAEEQIYAFQPAQAVEDVHVSEPRHAVEVAHIVEQLEAEPFYAEPQAEPISAEPVYVEPVDPEPQPLTVEWHPEPRHVPIDLDAHYQSLNPHAYEAQPELPSEPQPVETHGELVLLSPEPPMAFQSGPMLQVAPQVIVDYHPPSREFAYPPETPARRAWMGLGSFIQLTGAALLAVAIFAVMTGQLNIRWLGPKQQQAALPAAPPTLPPAAVATAPAVVAAPAPAPLPFPMPASYGVYVLHNDKLTELERFGIRVPDARVPISPEIREPARAVVPDGKVSFVVFRRELVNGAPEKVPVRVVAKIAREMTFTDGKAATTNVENLWRIRNSAFDFRVAPVADNRELIMIRPDADFTLPAGRYALVINGQGYDFAIAGKITSPQQCLERIETVNGAIYSECRNPPVN